ncbi:aldoketomutase [Hypericibacter adhaerens]|jgi:catechol 2,3-dioxygenase-like lactoylglutathione lyase family enzyme|uniref:Bleomycin resistance protein n=1 Tax=Hypericibacter adhaerens TaxID=2602016 RepID=A0A5J6N4C0_9PROT|nr:VOC family protein [Hypericibacter adhaerens]QEX24679.1 aldoketomutase [Hypericibacter adhaerens]
MTAPIAFNRLVPELLCRDFAASFAFYGEVLGFARLYGREDPPFAYLEFEGAQLMLEQIEDEASWLTGEMSPPFGRGINFQIETGDLDGLLARLARAGIALYRAPESAWYRAGDRLVGQRQFLVQDPDGYLLRFCQDLGERPLDHADAGARIVS